MPAATCVPDLLRARTREDPGHTALAVGTGPELTYGAWERRSDRAARGLRARGVGPGDRVLLHFDNADWLDFAVAYLAVHKAGAAAVPASSRFSPAELAGVAEHAGAGLLVCPRERPLDGPAGVTVADLEASGGDGAGLPGCDGERLAEIIYTSGTTGTPKGVACTHASILAHDLPGSVPDQPVAFAHAFPVGTNAGQECLRMPLRRRSTAVVLPVFDPDTLCALVAERGIERLQLVPAMAEMLVSSGAPSRFDVSSVQGIVLSSAPAAPALWQRLAAAFPGASLWNAYALTESGGARTLMRHDPDRPRCVGRPVGRTEVRVVGGDGTPLAAGEVGEVQLRRPGAPPRWYHDDPEATAAAFDGDWLRTGDLGRLDPDGFLHLVDRKKDLIISGGLNISSLEVAHALVEHPAVVEAAALGVPHPVLGQEVVAAVVLRAPASERDLQKTVRARLAEHKVPRRVEVVDSLPRNASGKVLKQELRERLAQRRDAGSGGPAGEIEAAVLAVWQEVLGTGDIGAGDDFFQLGGHSLAAAQVVARLQDRFGVDLPVTLVFEQPTISEQAGTVAETVARADRA